MSGEFGFGEIFFHQKIDAASDDCRSGTEPLTHAWGKVLDAMHDVAWSISLVEQGDEGTAALKIESVKALRAVREALYRVEALTSEVVDVQRETINGIIGSIAVVSDVPPDLVTVHLPDGFSKVIEQQPQRTYMIEKAIDEVVRRKKGYGWTRTSSTSGGGSNHEIHYYTNDKTAWRVRKEVRAALLNGDVAAALALLGEA